MGTSSGRGFGWIALGLALALYPFVGAEAQSAPEVFDPSTLDVAGVKLDMTLDQAVTALKSFNSNYTIVKHYWANTYGSIDQIGATPDELASANQGPSQNALDSKYAFLNDLVAESPLPACLGKADDDPCSNNPKMDDMGNGDKAMSLDSDVVEVWFSPIPGQERVIAVQRTKNYDDNVQSSLPALAAVQSIMATKFPHKVTYELDSYGDYNWVFDGHKRLITPDRVHAQGLNLPDLAGGMPSSVQGGDGISFSVHIQTASQNAQLVDHMNFCLFDGNALYASIAQGQATYEAQKAKMDAQNAANASQNGVKPSL